MKRGQAAYWIFGIIALLAILGLVLIAKKGVTGEAVTWSQNPGKHKGLSHTHTEFASSTHMHAVDDCDDVQNCGGGGQVTLSCSDSDGSNIFIPGTAIASINGIPFVELRDYCAGSSGIIAEAVCDGNKVKHMKSTCQFECMETMDSAHCKVVDCCDNMPSSELLPNGGCADTQSILGQFTPSHCQTTLGGTFDDNAICNSPEIHFGTGQCVPQLS